MNQVNTNSFRVSQFMTNYSNQFLHDIELPFTSKYFVSWMQKEEQAQYMNLLSASQT